MNGAERITKERRRQVDEKGWTAEHDDEHGSGDLALVGALYATPRLLYEETRYANGPSFRDPWPWDRQCDTRPYPDDGNVLGANEDLFTADRIRQLEKAGALMAAEIDRLLRVIGLA